MNCSPNISSLPPIDAVSREDTVRQGPNTSTSLSFGRRATLPRARVARLPAVFLYLDGCGQHSPWLCRHCDAGDQPPLPQASRASGGRLLQGWERFFALLGVLNLQFGPAYWVALHRRHHHLTDKAGDPHSPRDGFWRSHLFFVYPINDDTDPTRITQQYAKDLLADPFYAWFEQHELWHWATVVCWPLFFIAGYAIGVAAGDTPSEAIRSGWSVLVWAYSFASSWSGT